MNDQNQLKYQKIQTENTDLRKENAKLERALKKSEQAVAESRALLELKKKVCLILEENVGS